MTGPKLNEASFVVGERSGVKSSAKYVKSSAYKAREVLNLIRGVPVRRADELLQFTDREVSGTIRKVLASAVANAQHNDELDPETLFVKACFADEGPTLKRFTPRARGRAGAIRKRTSHITIVLGVLDDERLEVVQAREARRTAAGRRRGAATTGAASRRARVERSRARAAGLKSGDADAGGSDEITDDQIIDDQTESTDAAPQGSTSSISSADSDLPKGAVAANEDESAPDGYDIKGNADSGLYHVPGSRFYNQTVAEFWFASAEDAEAAGFQLPPSQRDADDESDASSESDATPPSPGESEADAEEALGTDAKEDN